MLQLTLTISKQPSNHATAAQEEQHQQQPMQRPSAQPSKSAVQLQESAQELTEQAQPEQPQPQSETGVSDEPQAAGEAGANKLIDERAEQQAEQPAELEELAPEVGQK